MADRFGGIPVGQAAGGDKDRFGGVRVAAPAPARRMMVQPDLGFVPALGPILRAVGYDGQPRQMEEGYEPSSVPILDPISTFANRAVEAVPIIGKPIADFGRSVEERLYGEDPGTRQQIEDANAAQYPVAAVSGDGTGTVAPFMLAGGTTLGARLLGMTGSLPARAGFGAATAGGTTFVDSLARGEGMDEALNKTKWAAGLGVAFPVAERLAGIVVRAATGNALKPAESAIASAIEADGIDVKMLAAKVQQVGPEAILADLGPNMQRLAGAVASLPGMGQKIVRDALAGRAAGTNARITTDVDSILGRTAVPSELDAGLKLQQDALGPEYRAAFDKARAVDTSDLATTLESEIVNLRGDAQKALKQVRGMLDIEGAAGTLDPNPYTLFQTRQAIDGMLETEVNSKVIAALTRTRKEVDGILTKAVPGIKNVDEKFAELAKQREALTQGQQLLDSGRTAMRPEELDTLWGSASGGVQLRLSQGARAEIDRIIGTTANNLTALKSALKGDGSWNRDRLRTLFGRPKADKLLDVLEREKLFDATNRIVTQNSETAARTAMQREVEHVDPQVTNTTLTGLLLAGGQKVANLGARIRRAGTNAEIADMLVGNSIGGDRYQAVVDALLSRRARSIAAPASVAMVANALAGQ